MRELRYIFKNKSLESAIEDYMEHCIYRNLAIETQKYYSENLRYFSNFVRSKKKVLSY